MKSCNCLLAWLIERISILPSLLLLGMSISGGSWFAILLSLIFVVNSIEIFRIKKKVENSCWY